MTLISSAPAAVRRAPSLGLSLLVAVLPKCPVCVAAHATVLGSLGLAEAAAAPWVRGFGALAVAAAVGLLAWRAELRRGYRPFALGCVGGALVLAELLHRHPAHAHHPVPHAQWPVWAGIAILAAASLWNSWPRRTHACSSLETAAAQC
jgi:mercuric ion transport protein